MALRLLAQEAVTRVRRRIQDENATAWIDEEILEAIDSVLEELHEDMRMAGRDWSMMSRDLSIADFTEEEPGLLTYRLPEPVSAVRAIKGYQGANVVSVDYVNLDQIDLGRSPAGPPVWTFWDGNSEGTIALAGCQRYATFKLFFVNRFPDLHYGTSPGGGLNAITFDNTITRVGPLALRDDAYSGVEVAWTSGPLTGSIGRVVTFDPVTFTATMDRDWPGVPTPNQTYELVVPLPPQFNNYLVERVAHHIYLRAGNDQWLMAAGAYLEKLERKFHDSLGHRVQNTPKRLHSSRLGG